MAKLGISTGTTPDDGTGDSLLDGAVKINSNFDEIYTFFGDGTNLTGAGVTYITAGSGISVDQNTGNVTITATGGGGGGESYWSQNATGINTTSNVGIGTTTASSALTVFGTTTTTNLVSTNGAVIDGLQIAQDSLTGTGNIGIGDSNTLGSTTGGDYNIAIGQEALDNIRNGDNNIAIGYQVGKVLNASDSNYGSNVLIGYQSFLNMDAASNNVAVGYRSLYGTTSSGTWDATQMTSVGAESGYNLENSRFSSFFGYQSGYSQTSADYNTFLGYRSGRYITTGDSNVILGSYDGNSNGLDIRTSSNNVVISDGSGNIRFYANPSGNVGIGTTTASSALTVKGNTSLETLNVSGVSTLGAGVTVTGTTFTDQLSVSGFTTYSEFRSETPGGKYVAFDDAASGLYLSDDTGVYLGEGYDLQLEHIAVGAAADRNRILSINGNLDLETIAGSISIKKYSGGEFIASFTVDAGVDLYYDNVKKFETLGAGVTVTGTTFTDQLSVSGVSTFGAQVNINTGGSSELNLGAPNDLYLQWDEGSQSAWLNTSATGNLYVQNGANGGIFLNAGTSNQTGVYLYPSDRVELRHAASKKFETTTNGVSISGIITAVSGIVTYYGDTSNTVDGRWTLTGDGSNYTLSGIGITSGNNTDPILYFARGRVYEFVNTQPVSHPFVIRDSDGGTDWTAGITTSTDGTNDYLRFEVPMNAPNTLYYQCTVHSGMGNTISVYPNLFT